MTDHEEACSVQSNQYERLPTVGSVSALRNRYHDQRICGCENPRMIPAGGDGAPRTRTGRASETARRRRTAHHGESHAHTCPRDRRWSRAASEETTGVLDCARQSTHGPPKTPRTAQLRGRKRLRGTGGMAFCTCMRRKVATRLCVPGLPGRRLS